MPEPPLCRCYRVSAAEVREAVVERGLRSVEEVAAAIDAAGGCQSCHDDVQAILDQVRGARPRTVTEAPPLLSNAEARSLVTRVLDETARPLFKLNGLEIELLDVHGERAFVRYRGANAGRPVPSVLTLKWWLVTILSRACGRRMQQIEMNVLEEQGPVTLP